jgi:putative cell wall-binding protein
MIDGRVKRLSGSNRYATNLAVLNEAGVEGEDLLIASGNGFADALSASAAKRPIFLVGASLNSDQVKYLNDNASKMSGQFYVIGGKGAVSYDIEDVIMEYGTVKRLSGKTRYLTSIAVANEFFQGKVDTVVIANGNNFPDGLSGGPIAAAYDAPLVLVVDNISDHAESYFKAKDSYRLVIMGGKGVISDETAERIFGGTV